MTIPLLTEEALFTWEFQRWVTLFKYLQEFKIKELERLIFDDTPINVGSHVSKLNVFGTNRVVVPNDKFSSVWDHIHATPTIKHAWATPGHTVMGGC